MTTEQEGGLFPYDYCYLWAAGRLAWQGADVYDCNNLARTMQEVGWPESEKVWGFVHPPWTMWAYLPYSLFSFPVARVLWMLTLIGLLLIICRECLNLSRTYPNAMPRLPQALMILAVILFPPVLKILAFGQVSLLLAIGVLFFLRFSLRGSLVNAGLALSLTLLKPHLFIPFYCALLAHALLSRDGKLPLGMLLGLLIQQGICSMLYPQGIQFFVNFLPQLATNSASLLGATPTQIAAHFFGWSWLRPCLFGAGVVIGILAGSRKSFCHLQALRILIPLSLLTAPYCFSHEFIILLPAYLTALFPLYQRYGEKIRFGIVSSAVLMALIIAFIHLEFLTVILPTTLLIFGLFSATISGKLACIAHRFS